jgi:cholesterol oxidase
VADGSIVPKALGLNPSRTIAALAEHIAAGIAAGL